MKAPEPFFMTNSEWYYHDEKDFCYKLTDKAPKEAVESYIDHYKTCVYRGEDILLELGYISREEWLSIVEEKSKAKDMK